MSRIALSKSAPPRCISPLVEIVLIVLPSIVSTDISKVPPPKSKTRQFYFVVSLFASRCKPYESAAAVGSFRSFKTLSPAISAASFVACFYLSLK